MKKLLLILIRAYQLGVSPFLGQSCRFYPTCSNYAVEAIVGHGALKGAMLATKRLCKCHPWHPGGVDPVPPPAAKKSPENSSTTACGCGHS